MYYNSTLLSLLNKIQSSHFFFFGLSSEQKINTIVNGKIKCKKSINLRVSCHTLLKINRVL